MDKTRNARFFFGLAVLAVLLLVVCFIYPGILKDETPLSDRPCPATCGYKAQ
jgi:hypothetical protein